MDGKYASISVCPNVRISLKRILSATRKGVNSQQVSLTAVTVRILYENYAVRFGRNSLVRMPS